MDCSLVLYKSFFKNLYNNIKYLDYNTDFGIDSLSKSSFFSSF